MGKNLIIKGADFSENAIEHVTEILKDAFNLPIEGDTRQCYIDISNNIGYIREGYEMYNYKAFRNYELPYLITEATIKNVRCAVNGYIVFLDSNLNIVTTAQMTYPTETEKTLTFVTPIKYVSASNDFNVCPEPVLILK